MEQFELTADGAGVVAQVTVEEAVDEALNQSVLAITLQLKSRSWYGVTYWLEGSLGGNTLDKTVHYAYLGALNTYYPVEETFYLTVPHEPDGSGSAVIDVNIRGTVRTGGMGSGWRIQGSHSLVLTPIARASTVGATDATIGSVAMIAVSRRMSSYTHTLHFSFGSLSGYLDEGGAISQTPVRCTAAAIAFPIPESFYYQIPDSPTGVCRLTCQTYNGQEAVGLPSEAAFTVTADPAKCAPTLTARVTDTNEKTLALTADPNTLVRFFSHALCESTAQTKFGARLVSKTPDGTVEAPEQEHFSFNALDSRGYEARLTVTVPMVPYVLLTANLSCRRSGNTENTAVLTVRGSCFNGSFGVKDNSLQLTATAGGQSYAMEPVFNGHSYTASCVLQNLDYTQSHTITVTATDLLQTVQTQVQLGQGVPVFDWGQQDFAFHVPMTAPAINGSRNIFLRSWPVGAVLLTGADRSPADTVGGVWQKLDGTLQGLYLWQRLQGGELLGTAVLGKLVLGEEC